MDEERDTSLAVSGWSMWGEGECVGVGGVCGGGGSSIVEME